MSIFDAIANAGSNTGAGLNAYARNKFALDENRRLEAKDDQRYNQSMALQQDKVNIQWQRAATDHATQTRQRVMEAKTAKQAQARWLAGMKEAVDLGYMNPQEAQPDAWRDIWEKPATKPPKLMKGYGADGQPAMVPEVKGARPYEEKPEWLQKEEWKQSQPPPPMTPKEKAQLRKAEADATVAENKASESTRKSEAAAAGAEEIKGVALSLLAKNEKGEYVLRDGVSRVYGLADQFFPSIGDAYEAEADIDRLVNLLTLANTDKMTGVLSESDIKILRDAGTVLSKKGLSERRVLEELKKIAEVFDRYDEAALEQQAAQIAREVLSGGTD